jgi:hypothetical protein
MELCDELFTFIQDIQLPLFFAVVDWKNCELP